MPVNSDYEGTPFWLLFTCVSDTAPSRVEAVRLTGMGITFTPDTSTLQKVLDPSTLGSYAAAGVSGAEPVIAFPSSSGGTARIRLWFLARAVGGRTTVGMAEGNELTTDLTSILPTFSAYAANPVLTPESPVIGPCGSDGCPTIEGLAVTRQLDAANKLRFLVARRLNDSSGQTYDLLPLEQFWRAD